MKQTILFGAVLLAGLITESMGQTQTQKTSTGVVSQQGGTAKSNTSSVEGMERKGSGKMASGVTRNGNSNLSPTAPTNTQGSTSQGSASVPSAGGAKETRTMATKQPNTPKSAKINTTPNGGTTGNTSAGGAKVDTKSTSGSTGGSKRPTSVGAVQKEARTSDKNVSTNGPKPTGADKSGMSSGSAAGKKAGGNSNPQGGSKN